MERFPTPSACANAPLADVLDAWQGLGYPRRAKALHDTARTLRDEYDDTVPSSVEALRQLPGIGEYTSAAVASFAFGKRVAVVDTNVGRVLARAVANRTLRASEARTLARELLPRTKVAGFNQAMLDLGAQFCRAVPRCDVCPVAAHCAWRREGGEDPAPNSAAVSRPQSSFEGSNRQLRGRVLRALLDGPHSRGQLAHLFPGVEASRLNELLRGLVHDGLVSTTSRTFSLPT
jgi:A/G-specific adenine glycosylase